VGTFAKFALIALVALALTVLPGGGGALDVTLALISIAFFTAIAVLGYRLYLRFRGDIEGLPEGQRWAFYGAIGLAFVTLCATGRLFDAGGVGAVTWLALLGLCSFALYWVWGRYRSYG
jgi:hypothetical protein